ncbi:hypothetical protein B0H13DRAFT_1866005 [Mycena leptocephala]|nr:hypothetical protein B0H13DRAFT_1866005 [Mycena leptocephala]
MYGSQEVSIRGSRQFHSVILTGTVGAASRALAKVATKVPKVQKIALCAKFMTMYGAQEVSTRGSRQFLSPILTGTLGAVSQALAKVVAKVTVAPSRSNQARLHLHPAAPSQERYWVEEEEGRKEGHEILPNLE